MVRAETTETNATQCTTYLQCVVALYLTFKEGW